MNPTDALAASLRNLSAATPRAHAPKTDDAAGRDGAGFEAALDASVRADAAMRAENDFERPIVQTARHESRQVAPLEKFEGFVLRSFVEQMLPSENSSYFGTGTAGNIWRSMLAEQIGKELAASGGIGIAKLLASRGEGTAAAVAIEARSGPKLPIGSAAVPFAPSEPDEI